MDFVKTAAVAFAALLVLSVILVLVAPSLPALGGDCVGVVRIDGDISSGGGGDASLFLAGGTSAEDVELALADAQSDSRVKSILLAVNSPGGSPVASKRVFDAVRAAAGRKPVVAYLGDVAASGGYYAAAPARWIIADPYTLTGSVGARAQLLNYGELLRKLGVSEESVKSGALKDMGAGYRNATPEERALLAEVVRELASGFQKDVEESRGAKIRNAFYAQALDARVLSAQMALRAGLVDEVGGYRTALAKAAEYGGVALGGVEGDGLPVVCVKEKPFSLWDALSGFSERVGERLGASFGKGFVQSLSAGGREQARTGFW